MLVLGYIYSNEDVVINWWNLLKFDRSKIWQGGVVDWRQLAYGPIVTEKWIWWETLMGLKACQNYYVELKRLATSNTSDFDLNAALQLYIRNGDGNPRCEKGWADMFYVPAKYAQGYVKLSDIAYENKLILEIAANNIIRSLDKIENFEFIEGTYLPDLGIQSNSAFDFWKTYNLDMTFIHPIKFNTKEKVFTRSLYRKWIVHYKNMLVSC